MSWDNQVAVVTGGARGLGRAIVRRLARDGVAVCVNYATRADDANALAAEIAKAGGRAIAVQADVAQAAEVDAMIERATAELGPVSVLVNNAGIAWQATLETFEADRFARMRAVNVDGMIHSIRAVAAGMRARKYGRIVNITSIASYGTTLPFNAYYAATKAEVSILTKRFAMELGADGITCNAVAPGFVRTDMTQGMRGGDEWQKIETRFAGSAIMGRIGEPDDIAHAVAFLAAPDSSWITAQILTVDGGRLDYLGHS